MGKMSKPQRSNRHKKMKAIDPFYVGDRPVDRFVTSLREFQWIIFCLPIDKLVNKYGIFRRSENIASAYPTFLLVLERCVTMLDPFCTVSPETILTVRNFNYLLIHKCRHGTFSKQSHNE